MTNEQNASTAADKQLRAMARAICRSIEGDTMDDQSMDGHRYRWEDYLKDAKAARTAYRKTEDRAVEISRRERVGTEEEVERVATKLEPMFRGFAHGNMPRALAEEFARAAISAMTPAAEVERLRVLETAARALVDDVLRRHPGEELHCPLMRALDEASLPAPASGDPKP